MRSSNRLYRTINYAQLRKLKLYQDLIAIINYKCAEFSRAEAAPPSLRYIYHAWHGFNIEKPGGGDYFSN